MERMDFLNVDTARLKVMFKSSQTIITLCVLWSGYLLLVTAIVMVLSFAPSSSGDYDFWLLYFLIPSYLLFGPAIVGGIKRTGWGRMWGIIVCVFMCPGLPVGTFLGFIGLNAYLRKELFGKQEILHSDMKKEYVYRLLNNIN